MRLHAQFNGGRLSPLMSSVGWVMSQGDAERRPGWSLSINTSPRMLHFLLFTHNQQPFHLFTFYSSLNQHVHCTFLSVCLPYLSAFLRVCLCLSFFPRHTDMGLFARISHFLFGVCIRSLVLVPNTHQTLKLLKMKKRKRGGHTGRI